jgi:hypothetical protein
MTPNTKKQAYHEAILDQHKNIIFIATKSSFAGNDKFNILVLKKVE